MPIRVNVKSKGWYHYTFLEEEDPEKEDKLEKIYDKCKTNGHGSKELRHGPTSKFQQNKKMMNFRR